MGCGLNVRYPQCIPKLFDESLDVPQATLIHLIECGFDFRVGIAHGQHFPVKLGIGLVGIQHGFDQTVNTLLSMIRGQQPNYVPAVSTPLDRPQRYGLVEMARADFQALRDKVAGRSASVDTRPAVTTVQMINIGTGEMPMDEFIALKNMVEGTDIFGLYHLAATHP